MDMLKEEITVLKQKYKTSLKLSFGDENEGLLMFHLMPSGNVKSVFIDVHFKFQKNYPKSILVFSIEKYAGLPEKMVNEINQSLHTKAMSLCGELMLVPLVTIVYELFKKWNIPDVSSSLSYATETHKKNVQATNFHTNRNLQDDAEGEESIRSFLRIKDDEWNDFKKSSRLFKNFEVLRKIGDGGQGKVFLAKHKEYNDLRALKLIKLDPTDKNVKKEVEFLSSMNHSNIVRFFTSWTEQTNWHFQQNGSRDNMASSDSSITFGSKNLSDEPKTDNYSDGISSKQDSGPKSSEASEHDSLISSSSQESIEATEYLCIEMEYCQNGTLDDEIRKGHLFKDFKMAWPFAKQILEALKYIHSKGICHRDLKPENILIDDSLCLKLADFGLAKRNMSILSSHESLYMTGNLGTKLYCAPEMLGKERIKFSFDIDMYAFGLILFELLLPPITTMMEKDKIFSLLKKELSFSNLPDYVREGIDYKEERYYILLCLQRDPKFRPKADWLLHHIKEMDSHATSPTMTQLFTKQCDPRLELLCLKNCSCFKDEPRSNEESISHTQECYSVSTGDVEVNAKVIAKLKTDISETFRLFGAIPLPLPLFIPKMEVLDHYDFHPLFLDKSGRILTLPGKVVPLELSKFLCNKKKEEKECRFYSFQNVCGNLNGICIDDEHVCSYYLLVPHMDQSRRSYPCFEVYNILMTILVNLHMNVRVTVSHAGILNVIINALGLTDTVTAKIYKLLDGLIDKEAFVNELSCLEQILDKKRIGILRKIFLLRIEFRNKNSIAIFLRKLTVEISKYSRQNFEQIFAKTESDLIGFLNSCEALNLSSPVWLTAVVSESCQCFNGLCFQISEEDKTKLATGGLYHPTIWNEICSDELSVFGFKLHLNPIIELTLHNLHKIPGTIQLRSNCDVMIWGKKLADLVSWQKELHYNKISSSVAASIKKQEFLAMVKRKEKNALLGLEVLFCDAGRSSLKIYVPYDNGNLTTISYNRLGHKKIMEELKKQLTFVKLLSRGSIQSKFETFKDNYESCITFIPKSRLSPVEEKDFAGRVHGLIDRFRDEIHIFAAELEDEEFDMVSKIKCEHQFEDDEFNKSVCDIGCSSYLNEVSASLREGCRTLKKSIYLFSYSTGNVTSVQEVR